MTSGNKLELVREGLRLAELNLTGEVTLMLAADQRATTLSGIVIAAVAIVASIYEADTASWNDDFGLLLLMISAGMLAYTARSAKIYIPGNQFKNLQADIKADRDMAIILRELGEICDEMSLANRKLIKRNSRLYNLALTVSVLGLILSFFPSVVSLIDRFCMFCR